MLDWTNLAERSNDGLTVSLDFRPVSNAFEAVNEIRVKVSRNGDTLFTLYPNPQDALACFHHPYSYAYRALSAGRLDAVPSFS